MVKRLKGRTIISNMMIRLISEDGKSAVELFEKDQPDELMGEGHPRQRHFELGLRLYAGVEAKGAPDHEGELADSLIHPLLQELGKFNGGELFAVFVEQHRVIGSGHEPELSLGFPLHHDTGCHGWAAMGRNYHAFKRDVARQPFFVDRTSLADMHFCGTACLGKNNFHACDFRG